MKSPITKEMEYPRHIPNSISFPCVAVILALAIARMAGAATAPHAARSSPESPVSDKSSFTSAPTLADYASTIWRAKDGLPQNEIHSIRQTPDGYLWISTTEGVARFDGIRFTPYNTRNTPGLATNNVTDLFLDADENLWMFGNGVFSRYRDGKFDDWRQRITALGETIRYFMMDGRDQPFIVTDKSIYRIGHGRFEPACAWTLPPNAKWDVIDCDSDGSIWIARFHGGLYRVHDGVMTCMMSEKVGKAEFWDTNLIFVARDRQGDIWLNSGEGIYRLEHGRPVLKYGQHTHNPNATGLSAIYDFVEDDEGLVWVEAAGHLYQLSGAGLRLIGAKDGLAYPVLHAFLDNMSHVCVQCGNIIGNDWTTHFARRVNGHFEVIGPEDGAAGPFREVAYVDRDNNLWLGTENGLQCLQASRVRTIGARYGLPPRTVSTMTVDSQGGLWVGLDDGSVCRFNHGRFRVVFSIGKLNQRASNMRIVGMAFDSDGVLWISNMGDLYRWKQGVLKECATEVFGGNACMVGMCRDVHGDVWLNGMGKIARAHNGKVQIMGANQGLTGDWHYVFDATPMANGDVWFGEMPNVLRYSGGRFTTYGPHEGMPNVPAISFHRDADGTVWIALWGAGVARWRDGRIKFVSTTDGLYADGVLQILDDDVGNLWFGSDRGIFSVPRRQLNAYLDGQARSFECYPCDSSNESAHSQAVGGSTTALRLSDGSLWFSTMKGLVRMEQTPSSPIEIVPIVENVSVDDRTYSSASPFVAPPGAGKLVVDYTTVCFRNPELARFRTKLVGFDSDWSLPTAKREVTYTNLPPGDYVLMIAVGDVNGHWRDQTASVTFTIRPHFHQTLAFRLLIILMFAAVMGVLYPLRLWRMRRRNAELQDIVDRRTQILSRTNDELLSVRDELSAQNDELQAIQAEVESRNEDLETIQVELKSRNATLEAIKKVVESRNAELQAVKADLEVKNESLAVAILKLETLATTDGLTGVRNHRAFQEELERQWLLSRRTHSPLSLVLMDVDRFKQYNDAFGHPAGDEVLKAVGRILQEHARETDYVARYGGEEFVVILPDTDSSGAIMVAERLRVDIAHATWPFRDITASFGLSTISVRMPSVAALISEADRALYASKDAGRNRVAHAESLVHSVAVAAT